ncbi:MAG: hypothetical protein HC904_05505 [Blastochloris sp.]|nr:hypothetical protein [Blastochloris sp.]
MFKLIGTEAAISILGNGNEWTTLVEDSAAPLKSGDAPKRGRAARMVLYTN